ncbi:hypothetical protein CGRA01v4_08096 [Colletotrichum graminicola]|nr:hypothetical protein CGRA01v4_08096 [Colletotrichum graminicola]
MGVAESCRTRPAPSRYRSAASFFLQSYLSIYPCFRLSISAKKML